MMIRSLLAGSLLIAAAIAQVPADPKPDQPSADKRMSELREMQKKCLDDWRAESKKAQEAAKNAKPGETVPAMSMRPDLGPVAEKAMSFATEFAGSDDAVQFLVMAMQSSTDQKVAQKALDVLLTGHLDSAGLAKIGSFFPHLSNVVGKEAVGPAMDKLGKSANVTVRGWATFAKHQSTIETGARDSEAYAAAKAELLKTVDEAGDKQLASHIRQAIDLREKYGAGNAAPDIAGVDLDGVAFKLSDYKGKVIFLDFWGDW
jgi:hypothetical protein